MKRAKIEPKAVSEVSPLMGETKAVYCGKDLWNVWVVIGK